MSTTAISRAQSPGPAGAGAVAPAGRTPPQPQSAASSSAGSSDNMRVLVIDDSAAIHEDFRKILASSDERRAALEEEAAALFGIPAGTDPGPAARGPSRVAVRPVFQVDSACQGQEGLELVRRARQEGRPYALAFVDVRMPPGWDGIETTAHLWEADPELQVVICTAYSDYSWSEMIARLGQSDRLLILKKPFDNIEVIQLAAALTAKWNLARQARRRLDELEQRVAERTRELQEQKDQLAEALTRLQEAHAQLLQADKMASIGQLAAGVAHEINNPIGFISSNLNSLAGYVADLTRVIQADEQLLVACRQYPGIAETVQRLEQLRREVELEYLLGDVEALIGESIEGTQRVRQIVSDLRDFSHVDKPDVTEEDLNRLLDKTINVCWNELKYKTEVVRQYGELPPIRCYGGKLGQVFLNLLVNAAQAIEERGTITVRTGQRDDGWVWVEVADTGCGIRPENLRRIFEPFFTTKEVGKGTGMGLHLAYKIVEAHGGRINVESVVGQGSTFRVELPVEGPPDEREHQPSRHGG